MTNEVITALELAAKETKVPLQELKKMAWVESRGNPKAVNVASQKYGLMQMGDRAVKDVLAHYPAAKEKGLTWELVKTDVNMNALAGAYYYKLNKRYLAAYGIESNPLNQYLAHQQGIGGFSLLLRNIKSDPTMPVSSSQLANLGRDFVAKKGGAGKITQQDFYDYWVAVFEAKAKGVN